MGVLFLKVGRQATTLGTNQSHRNASGLFWTDFDQSETSHFASSSLICLSWKKQVQWNMVIVVNYHVSAPN
jgi:hypothetical protein